MEKRISLREANQHISRYVADVERGDRVIITRRGRPVAQLIPVTADERLDAGQRAALARTVERMKASYHLGGARLKRDELHDR